MNEHIDHLLLNYLDGTLHSSEQAQVETHLEYCESCRAELAEWRLLTTAVNSRAQKVAVSLPPLALPIAPYRQNGSSMPQEGMNVETTFDYPLPRRASQRNERSWGLAAVMLIVLSLAMILLLTGRPANNSPLGAGIAQAATETAPIPTAAMVEIVVAAQYISYGTLISADMVQLQPWPVDALPTDAVLDTESVIRQYARTDIEPGQPIVASLLITDFSDTDLAAIIPDGMVAIAIPRDQTFSTTALEPGEWVAITAAIPVIQIIDTQYQQTAVPQHIFPPTPSEVFPPIPSEVLTPTPMEGEASDTPLCSPTGIITALVLAVGDFAGFAPSGQQLAAETEVILVAVTPQEAVVLAYLLESGVQPFAISACACSDAPSMTEIVVANREIRQRTLISAGDVTLREWPESAVPANSFTDLTAVIGQYARADMYMEQPLLQSLLTDSAPFELGGQISSFTPEAIAAMQQSGMTWAKTQIRYQVGDSADSVATSIQTAHDNSFKLLVTIVGDPNEMTDFASYINQYAEFAAQVAALGADAIEVWNEPNLDRGWPTGQIDGANYAQLLAAAYDRIKDANPATLVISAAPSPTGSEAAFPGAVVNDDNFLRQMAEAGAADSMDCLGLYYNEGVVPPSVTTGDPRNDYPTHYFDTMLERGAQFFPNTPMCWTELGYLSPEGFAESLPDSFLWGANTTVAQQAEWLWQAAQRSVESGKVRLMIVWNVNFEGIAADPMGAYAIIRPDDTCPACGQLGAFMAGLTAGNH